jgi:hypothetical protein
VILVVFKNYFLENYKKQYADKKNYEFYLEKKQKLKKDYIT